MGEKGKGENFPFQGSLPILGEGVKKNRARERV